MKGLRLILVSCRNKLVGLQVYWFLYDSNIALTWVKEPFKLLFLLLSLCRNVN